MSVEQYYDEECEIDPFIDSIIEKRYESNFLPSLSEYYDSNEVLYNNLADYQTNTHIKEEKIQQRETVEENRAGTERECEKNKKCNDNIYSIWGMEEKGYFQMEFQEEDSEYLDRMVDNILLTHKPQKEENNHKNITDNSAFEETTHKSIDEYENLHTTFTNTLQRDQTCPPLKLHSFGNKNAQTYSNNILKDNEVIECRKKQFNNGVNNYGKLDITNMERRDIFYSIPSSNVKSSTEEEESCIEEEELHECDEHTSTSLASVKSNRCNSENEISDYNNDNNNNNNNSNRTHLHSYGFNRNGAHHSRLNNKLSKREELLLRRFELWERRRQARRANSFYEQLEQEQQECTFTPDVLPTTKVFHNFVKKNVQWCESGNSRSNISTHNACTTDNSNLTGLLSSHSLPSKHQPLSSNTQFSNNKHAFAENRSRERHEKHLLAPSTLYANNKAWGFDEFVQRMAVARAMKEKRKAEQDAELAEFIDPSNFDRRVTTPKPFHFCHKSLNRDKTTCTDISVERNVAKEYNFNRESQSTSPQDGTILRKQRETLELQKKGNVIPGKVHFQNVTKMESNEKVMHHSLDAVSAQIRQRLLFAPEMTAALQREESEQKKEEIIERFIKEFDAENVQY